MERLKNIYGQFKEPTIIFNYDHNVCEVILNKPKMFNATSIIELNTLEKHLRNLEKNPNINLIFLKGKGPAFCAGGDIKSLMLINQSQDSGDDTSNKFTIRFNAYMYHYSQMKPIQIAIWDGIVMGGGVGISIFSKIRIATEKAKFAMPEAKIGLLTDVGASYFLNNLRKGFGLYMALTGTTLVGEEIVQVGLADYYVRHDNLEALENEVKRQIIQNPNLNISQIKAIIEKFSTKTKSFHELEHFTEKYFCKKTLEEILEGLEKAEKTPIIQKVLKEINENCPKSLRVIFELYKRTRSKTLKECIGLELPAYLKLMKENDFFEGVMSKLVNKSAKPNWTHKTIYEIKEEEVQAYFKDTPIDIETYWDNKEYDLETIIQKYAKNLA